MAKPTCLSSYDLKSIIRVESGHFCGLSNMTRAIPDTRPPIELPNHAVMRIIMGVYLIGINERDKERYIYRERGMIRVGILLEG